MTVEVDSETRKYLRELDSFGLPPEPFKIVTEAELSPPRVHVPYTQEFRQKLHKINVGHQKVRYFWIPDEVESGTVNRNIFQVHGTVPGFTTSYQVL